MKKRMLPVAILAGGVATRLRPLTEVIPKALVDINGTPFIVHQLRLLRANGVEKVVICAGYLGEMISKFVGNGSSFGIKASFSFDGANLLGTAGAIRKALPFLGKSFFVLYGDSYLSCDYGTVQRAFDMSGKRALMTVFRNDRAWDTSNVEFTHGQILTYNKKKPTPRMRHIDYGLGVFHARAFDAIPEDVPYDLADLYQLLLKKGQLAAFEVKQRFYEIGSFDGLEELKRYINWARGEGQKVKGEGGSDE